MGFSDSLETIHQSTQLPKAKHDISFQIFVGNKVLLFGFFKGDKRHLEIDKTTKKNGVGGGNDRRTVLCLLNSTNSEFTMRNRQKDAKAQN